MQQDQLAMELDGWGNLLTGLGPENSSLKVSFSEEYSTRLDVCTLENLFTGGGIANIICTEIPADGMKNGVSIHGDDEGAITSNLETLGAYTYITNAWGSARAFGGAVLVMDIEEGASSTVLEEPVNVDKITAINSLDLYDRTNVRISDSSYDTDPNSDTFGELIYFYITKKDSAETKVHVSRVLYFAGDYLPWNKKQQNDYYDGSVIQRTWGSLSKLGPAFEYTNKLLQRFNVLKFGVKGLAEKIATGKEGEIKTRLRLMKMSMSAFNAAMYDADGEEITAETISVNGLPDLLKQYFVLVSAESRIPVNRLFTKLVGGIGNEGDSDESRYYDHVQHEQKRVLTGPYNKLIGYLAIAHGLSDVTWSFEPLKRYSKKELVDMRSTHTKSVTEAYEWQLISYDEARASLVSDDFTFVLGDEGDQ